MHEKHIASRVFSKRCREIGRLVRVMLAVKKTGVVHWVAAGPYEVQFDDIGRAETIKHVSTDAGVALNSQVSFTKACVMKVPNSDLEAHVVGPDNMGTFNLSSHFSIGLGPHTVAVAKDGSSLDGMAIVVKRQLAVQEDQVSKGRVVVFEACDSHRRRSFAEEARCSGGGQGKCQAEDTESGHQHGDRFAHGRVLRRLLASRIACPADRRVLGRELSR